MAIMLQMFSTELVHIGGEAVGIYLAIAITILLLLAGTKYWNEYVLNAVNSEIYPLICIFVATVIFNIMVIV